MCAGACACGEFVLVSWFGFGVELLVGVPWDRIRRNKLDELCRVVHQPGSTSPPYFFILVFALFLLVVFLCGFGCALCMG